MSNAELIDYLEKQYSPSEIVEMLDNFKSYDLEEYALENMVCVKCYSNLVSHKWRDGKVEHFGCIVQEEFVELMCEGCREIY